MPSLHSEHCTLVNLRVLVVLFLAFCNEFVAYINCSQVAFYTIHLILLYVTLGRQDDLRE